MQPPRTRNIGGSVPEIEKKWKVMVYRYVELVCDKTLGQWSEARAEGKLVRPAGAVSVRTDVS